MQAGERIFGYDVARAFAIFGMTLVNYKVVMTADGCGPGWLAFATGLFEGRAAAVFVVLAGVGLSLASRRERQSGDSEALFNARKTLWKRAAFLFVVGMLYLPIYSGDILHFYGIYITIGALALSASGRWLWGLVAAFVIAFSVLILGVQLRGRMGFYHAGVRRTLDAFGHAPQPVFQRPSSRHSLDCFLLAGMWLGRQDMSDSSVSKRVFLIGAGVALFAEFLSAVLIETLTARASADSVEAIRAVFGTEMLPPVPLYMLAAGGTAFAVIAISVRLSQRFVYLRLHRTLVATGQLSLTLYVAHVCTGDEHFGYFRASGESESRICRDERGCIFRVGCRLFRQMAKALLRPRPTRVGHETVDGVEMQRIIYALGEMT